MSALLMGYEPFMSSSGLRPSRPRVETYSYVERPATMSVAPAVLPLFSFSVGTDVKRLSKPLLLRVAIEQGEYFVENDALHIFGNGPTLSRAVEFARDLAYSWQYYCGLNDDQVAGDAVTLKKLYEELVA